MTALAHVLRPGRFPIATPPVPVAPSRGGAAVFPPRLPAVKAPRLDITPAETPLTARLRELEGVNAALRLQVRMLHRENIALNLKLLKYAGGDPNDTVVCAPPVF